MTILRQIVCDVCENTNMEYTANEGWPGWGSLQGIKLDGIENPSLCPTCLECIASFIDRLKHPEARSNVTEIT